MPHFLTITRTQGRTDVTRTHTALKELELIYLEDYKKGLLTRTQLLNILHRLDRISSTLWQPKEPRTGWSSTPLNAGCSTSPTMSGLVNTLAWRSKSRCSLLLRLRHNHPRNHPQNPKSHLESPSLRRKSNEWLTLGCLWSPTQFRL